jgi:hypothetical protein
MSKEKRLNVQIKNSLILQLREIAVRKMKQGKTVIVVTLQDLADQAIKEFVKKNK